MPEPNLSNRALVPALYRRYYLEQNGAQGPLVSSHWERYSKECVVEMDGQGNLVALRGRGFGDMQEAGRAARALAWLCNASYALSVKDCRRFLYLRRPAERVAGAMGFHFSFDCFRQMCSLALVLEHLAEDRKRGPLQCLVIGDGYGYLSGLVKEVLPQARLVLVDLGRTLLFQAVFCQRAHPGSRHAGVFEPHDLAAVDFLYCPAEQLEDLAVPEFDVAFNIASMQEMNTETVARYFGFLRRRLRPDNLFYCCNRECKVLPAGEVSEFLGYPWSENDRHLVDELCPWYRYFLSLGRSARGPRPLGVRVPLVNYFDGPVRHRLTVLAKVGAGAARPDPALRSSHEAV